MYVKKQYDLIICDLSMPVMNGVTFYEVLRGQTNINQNTKFLMISGFLSSLTMNQIINMNDVIFF